MNWRQVGINYIRFSQICAQAVRAGVKANLRADAAKREGVKQTVKVTKWKDGKPARKEE